MGYKVLSSLLQQKCTLISTMNSLKTKLIVCGTKEGRDARSGVGKHFLRRATLKILLLPRATCSYYIYYTYSIIALKT